MKPAPYLIRKYLLSKGFGAITLPPFGIYALAERVNEERLAKHEGQHWKQYEQYGLIGFYAKYLYYQMKYGYHDNPMEVEARAAEVL